MATQNEITGRLLTRNWALNLVGQTVALLVALPTIPYTVRGLGPERFGILSIAWVLLGYFGLFDLGLGRATTKFVAECLSLGDTKRMTALVWTSLWSQVLFGAMGALIAVAATPVAVHRFLNISPSLIGETQATFFILAGSLPLVLAANALRGVLEAGQHFAVVNYVRVPANASIFVLPAVALMFGAKLPAIVWLLVLARVGAALAYLWFCLRLYPALRRTFAIDPRMVRPLLVYGGWVTVSSIVAPLLSYLDRFAVGSVISMAAVGYYTVPSEMITRLQVVPSSLSATVFPAFSSLDATASLTKLEELCVRSLKALFLTLGPLSLLVILFARQILQLWLGADFAVKGAPVLQILAAGALVNALSFVPFGMLQALGRPDLTAKFHLLELPFYAALLWFLLARMGITGAAVAWTIRVCLDAALLFGAVVRLRWVSLGSLCGNGLLRAACTIFIFAALLSFPWLALGSMKVELVFAGVLFPAFGLTAWKYLLDGRERHLLLSAFVARAR
jgi:O-antigen/teichoic acid export membrane protein